MWFTGISKKSNPIAYVSFISVLYLNAVIEGED